ncbi:hypothetical protein, partial [Salmonella sp. s55004]|uniref:hypothetical protein n=1 Tax=Salmonella sp. s55004 TaxID=3159675 RepID=UPI003980C3C9
MGAYAFFVQYKRKYFEVEHPPGHKLVFADFSKECAALWKPMTIDDKKPFQDNADKDKVRYDKEMSHYKPPKGEKKMGGKRRKKDPNAPKRNLSAFFLFSNDERAKVRAQHPEWNVGLVAKQLSVQWRAIDPTLKAKYDQGAVNDKERYQKAMAAYK